MTDRDSLQPAVPAGEIQISEGARGLIQRSKSKHTLRAYSTALKQWRRWLDGRSESDAALADYLASRQAAGLSPATGATLLAALAMRQRWARDEPSASPVGPLSRALVAGWRRASADKGRGQACPLTLDDACTIIATSLQGRRRKKGRGRESRYQAHIRGAEDAAIVGLLFYGGMRRSEVCRIRAHDVHGAGDAVTVHLRRSKTDPDGSGDVRLVKNGGAWALRFLRDRVGSDGVLIPLSPGSVNRRFQRAAAEAGIEGVSANSGRVGLAVELIRRGASTTATQHAGGWQRFPGSTSKKSGRPIPEPTPF